METMIRTNGDPDRDKNSDEIWHQQKRMDLNGEWMDQWYSWNQYRYNVQEIDGQMVFKNMILESIDW